LNWIKRIAPGIKSLLSPLKKRMAKGEKSLWTNCSCGKLTLRDEFEKNLFECSACSKTHLISCKQRFRIFFDESVYTSLEYGTPPEDPINFSDPKGKYSDRLEESRKKVGEQEAMLFATGKLNAMPVTVGSMDFKFFGASVSPSVGECFLSGVQHSINNKQPLILFVTSGGMRMHTGILSLMQMTRMTLACSELKKNKIPFIVVAGGPCLGGTTASMASLADIILSESKDFLWGFSGKRIIEQNLREKLADEVQTSQWVLEHGGIDKIVPRKELRSEIYNILSILLKVKEKEINNTDDANTIQGSLQTVRKKQVI
tara:strand:- start:1419 stop:2363 length:945 start_codon:yes stop_codon:yes gene_type:complete